MGTRSIWIPDSLRETYDLSPTAKYLWVVASQVAPLTLVDLGNHARVCRETVSKECACLAGESWMSLPRGRYGKRPVPILPPPAQQEAVEILNLEREQVPFLGEFFCKRFLDLFIPSGEYVDNARPSFLRKAESKVPQEYDRFYYRHMVAFEFNGDQHYVATPQYDSKQGLTDRQIADFNKTRLSKRYGVTLVEIVDEDLTLEGMRKKIPDRLPVRPVQEDARHVVMLVDMAAAYIANMRRKRAAKPDRQDDGREG